MMQEYNFNKVGKKMPYTTPERFFDQMQEKVLSEVAKEERAKHRRKAKLIRMYVAAASIVACVCVAVLIGRSIMSANTAAPHHAAATSVASVDKAYDNLSSEEQQELNATYANDVYLCME